ncbi:helix-turn-helix domain-containing protein [Microlunatus parietis]|uniref:DNA-binding transcriptional ArsR family regulator n=1 Tax=Microlunatus parietis TaxID=682979 RepID=A0A7Y9I3Z9_9ACTN|nr:helix-turn-helix domain-containing protein [Microlunatus parietis]NYE69851.1 DNA-binding transcriptional ArsR family regulator [Microlunatus parietis]
MSELSPAEDRVVVDGSNLRGLAHPLRIRLLGRLRRHGRATASMLAKEFDTTSGVLSYHLRQLERYGFISEDTEHGNRRDRWWRANHRTTEFDPVSLEQQASGRLLNAEIVQRAVERLTEAAQSWPDWPDEWRPRFDVSDAMLVLTPEQAAELTDRFYALIKEYPLHRPDQAVPAGSRQVAVQLQLFLDDTGPR